MMQELWNQRYSDPNYIYGIEPNVFFAEQLSKISNIGNILLPAEGEGRNAVFAAQLGWNVDAFDFSHKAKEKALELARIKKVKINYYIEDIVSYIPTENKYDIIALIYNHLLPEIRTVAHKKYIKSLKKGGIIIFEAFSKNQINNTSGGPKVIDLLYDLIDIKTDFSTLDMVSIAEQTIVLDEGQLHQGEGNVIRMFAYKRV